MLDKLDIYNLALSHLKEAPLVALTNNRKARTDCDIHYDIARLTLLKKHDWSFARQVIALTAITPDDDELIEGFDYYFEIPPEVLAIRGVYVHGDYENKLEAKEVYLPISKIKAIASNYDALDAICTMDIQESKYSVMPTATVDTVDKVVQYIGQTGGGYTKRAFYKGIATTMPSIASASIGSSTGITEASIVVATFEEKITITGIHTFTYDGSDWSYDGSVVDLADFGITVTGVADNSDTIIIDYAESYVVYSWQLTTEKAVSDNNLELLDITFCDALSFELAGRICPTITGDDNLAIQMLQKSELKVQEAKTANLSEKYMFQKRTSDTLNARG